MSTKGTINDSTIARIAGNLLSGYANQQHAEGAYEATVEIAVWMARAIAAEVERTSTRTEQA